MSLLPPAKDWYLRKVAKDEKSWIAIATTVCLMLFVWMVVWHVYGKQNPSSVTYRTTPAEFASLAESFIKKNRIGEDNGIPVVMPKPGSSVFILSQMWRWAPVLILKKGEEYPFHISSKDLTHGFSLQPTNMNFIVYPGYDYVLTFRPNQTGEYKVICNEFCGIGHHQMIGKIWVVENDAEVEKLQFKRTPKAKSENNSAAGAPSAPASEEELAANGESIMVLKGCNACHSSDGSKLIGPTYKGLIGKKEIVIAGGTESEITVDEAYIRKSILEPQAQIVKGFENAVMPPQQLTDEEIASVISYLRRLK